MERQAYTDMVLNVAPGILAALFYGIVSGSMSFINKIVLTSYSYHFPDVVMFFQVVATSIILEVCRKTGLCQISAWSKERCKEFVIPSFCFALHTTLALAALDDLSIPIYNVLRRMLPLATLITSIAVMKKYPSRGTTVSVSFIVTGSLIAGVADFKLHLVGYSDAILSVIAQSVYLNYVQKSGIEKGSSALSVLHLNSLNCIPLLFALTLLNGNLVKAVHFPGFKELGFIISFSINILFGCVLNYSLFLCATKNSALTTSFVGVIKGIITTVVGFFTFGGVPATFTTIAGVVLNSFGGTLYTYVKYKEKRAQLQRLLAQEAENEAHSTQNKPDLSNNMHGFSTRHRIDSANYEDEEKNGYVSVDVAR